MAIPRRIFASYTLTPPMRGPSIWWGYCGGINRRGRPEQEERRDDNTEQSSSRGGLSTTIYGPWREQDFITDATFERYGQERAIAYRSLTFSSHMIQAHELKRHIKNVSQGSCISGFIHKFILWSRIMYFWLHSQIKGADFTTDATFERYGQERAIA